MLSHLREQDDKSLNWTQGLIGPWLTTALLAHATSSPLVSLLYVSLSSGHFPTPGP